MSKEAVIEKIRLDFVKDFFRKLVEVEPKEMEQEEEIQHSEQATENEKNELIKSLKKINTFKNTLFIEDSERVKQKKNKQMCEKTNIRNQKTILKAQNNYNSIDEHIK